LSRPDQAENSDEEQEDFHDTAFEEHRLSDPSMLMMSSTTSNDNEHKYSGNLIGVNELNSHPLEESKNPTFLSLTKT